LNRVVGKVVWCTVERDRRSTSPGRRESVERCCRNKVPRRKRDRQLIECRGGSLLKESAVESDWQSTSPGERVVTSPALASPRLDAS